MVKKIPRTFLQQRTEKKNFLVYGEQRHREPVQSPILGDTNASWPTTRLAPSTHADDINIRASHDNCVSPIFIKSGKQLFLAKTANRIDFRLYLRGWDSGGFLSQKVRRDS
jgi:hypothetical protein